MTIVYTAGSLSLEKMDDLCSEQGLDPSKAIFLFPGNNTHHDPATTLFSIKDGSGLARLATKIGKNGGAALSMPTTNVWFGLPLQLDWPGNAKTATMVQAAIADLYRALGAGYFFILPVRPHQDQTFFSHGLAITNEKQEPSFWGGAQRTPNKALADHYIEALDNFQEFAALPWAERQKRAHNNAFDHNYAAYLQGARMDHNDPWLQPSLQSLFKQLDTSLHNHQKLWDPALNKDQEDIPSDSMSVDMDYDQQLNQFIAHVRHNAYLLAQPILIKTYFWQELTEEDAQRLQTIKSVLIHCNTLLVVGALPLCAVELANLAVLISNDASPDWQHFGKLLGGLAIIAALGLLAITPFGGPSLAVLWGAVVFEKIAVLATSASLMGITAVAAGLLGFFAHRHGTQPTILANSIMDVTDHYENNPSNFSIEI